MSEDHICRPIPGSYAKSWTKSQWVSMEFDACEIVIFFNLWTCFIQHLSYNWHKGYSMSLWPWFTIHNFCDIERVLEIDLMRLIPLVH